VNWHGRPLAPMLEARSVAVVGASARAGSFGQQLLSQLLRGGYQGTVHPVNPRYPEVLGLPCRPSLAELPGPVDLAVLAVPNHALEAELQAAADAAIPAAVIFASCAPQGLAERLRAIAEAAGMAVCGGNGMGFFNLEQRLRVCGYPEPEDLPCGPVAVVSHSGSVFSALLHNRRGLRFNLVVSCGMELVTSAAAYLDHALELESTRVVALFLETVREPAAFRAALAKAADRGVQVVALKVGRSRAGGEMVAAHSGALAGEDGAYQALFDAYGVARVDTLDELAHTCELFAAGRPAFPGGLAAIHDSGGERAHLIDLAEEREVRLAGISEATRRRLAAVLEPGLPATNPLDAWRTGNDADAIFAACIRALLEDPDTAALAINLDLTTEPTPETSYTGLAVEALRGTRKPVAVIGSLAAAIDPADAALLRAAGVPVLEGTATGLAAMGHLLAARDFHAHRPPASARPPPTPTGGRRTAAGLPGVPGGVRARWRRRLADAARPLGEAEALAMLADWGIPVAAAETVDSLAGGLAAARRLGWPVALKTAAPGVRHKSEVDGVRLGLDGPERFAAAYAGLAGRLGPSAVVAAMAPAGVELALGVVRDPPFGRLVMVAAGGVLVEALRDRRFALPPVDARQALALLDRLAVRPLLDGRRGGPPADLAAVADAVVRLSVLAVDLGDRLAALDVNLLIAGPAGCLVVDALVVQASTPPEG
jgi:acetate---CoA ligase (ADP-forming)